MLNGLIKWSITNRYAVIFMALLWLGYGLYQARQSTVDVFPDFAPIQVTVLTEAPGFAPEEVESLVTRPLEAGLNGTAQVKVVRSVSTAGLSVININFEDNTNVFTARQLVMEKLQSSSSQLPAEAKTPTLAPITSATGDILKIGLISTGKTSMMDLRTLADWTIKLRLKALSGVANVVVIGGDTRQYQIQVQPEKLKQYGVTLAQVVEATGDSNVNAPGGVLRGPESELMIRGLGRVSSVEDIAQSVIVARAGSPVLLGNVADIKIAPEFKLGDAIVNGQPGVVLTVIKQPWAGTTDTTDRIERSLAQLKSALPADVQMITTFRQSDFIEVAIKNVGEAILIGGVLVVFVLLLFLQNWRAALISLVAIPLSLITAVVFLKMQGLTINTMTLGGLAIAIGETVDDAIIDVENIVHRLRDNKILGYPKSSFRVVFDASSEVRGSVVYATLIVALVFLPVVFLNGLEGRIFSPLAVSYMSALMASLVVALTVTPALSYMLLRSSSQSTETAFVLWLKGLYRPLLQSALNAPRVVLGMAVTFFVLALTPLLVVGTEFLPSFDENNVIVVTNSLPGTSLSTTTNMGKELIDHFVHKHGVMAGDQRAGRAQGGEDYGAGNFSEFDFRLKPNTNKKDTLYHIRHEFAHVPGLISDMGSYLQHRMDHAISGVNAAIAVKVFGDDLDTLYSKASEIEKVIKTVRGAVDVHSEQIVPAPQISIKIDRTMAARYGLSAGKLARTLETAFKGSVVSQVVEGQRAFDVCVLYGEKYRNNIEVIRSTLIDTPGGATIPLSAVARVETSTGPSSINHENTSRRVVVQANVAGRDLGGTIKDIREKISREVKLPEGYYVVYGGQFEAQEEATTRLFWLGLLALVGMTVLLALAFKSMRAAVLIMSNLPLALAGGIVAVLLSGAVMSVGSLVGFVTLFGISTRNGIMLVTHFNQLLQSNDSLDDIIIKSCMDRLSPVLMTALTASCGVLPIAILGGAGRELEQPLAVVIVGGMVSSTCLTLFVIPALLRLYGADLSPIKRTPSGSEFVMQ
jgi:CzcA family heavy metal efflux pump